jgi:phospholipid/cholesterol/gamma-HCH transport system substrate-binding protein
MRRTRITGIVVGLALVGVAAATGVSALEEDGKLTVTAYFERATGVYAGSDLRILGVKVGTVQSVEPRGEEVKVVRSASPARPARARSPPPGGPAGG